MADMNHPPVWAKDEGNSAASSPSDRPGGESGEGSRIIAAVNEPIGRVLSLHDVLRFVIIEFPVHPMPALEQRLSVYRDGQKVGVLKVTGPAYERSTAADIIDGEAKAGDDVLPD